MTRGISLGLWVAALLMTAILAAATLLPLSSSPLWWVRAGEFPRLQIALGLVATLLLIAALPGRMRVVLAIGVGACLALQVQRMLPFTPLVKVELNLAASTGEDIRLLAANVKMENQEHSSTTAVIEAFDPDVLFLMETDAKWVDALSPLLARYPPCFVCRVPTTTASCSPPGCPDARVSSRSPPRTRPRSSPS